MRPLLLLAIVLVAGACSKASRRPAEPTPGTLAVTWTGSYTGKFEAPAEGRWCPSDSLLEITASRGDTGVGMAIFASDTITPGSHPIIAPAVEVNWRPISMVSVRWLKDTEILGFEGATGSVLVTQVSRGTVTGTIDWRLKVPGGVDTLIVKGRLTDVPYRAGPVPCGRVSHLPKQSALPKKSST